MKKFPIEITRNQGVDVMTHGNYVVTDASQYQEKLPKYAPIFVAVSFHEICTIFFHLS